MPQPRSDKRSSQSPARRLQSPAERFAPPAPDEDAAPDSMPTEPDASIAPDPFQPLPDAPSKSSPARANRAKTARRAPKPHAPRHHEKRPHQVAHLPVKPAPVAASQRPAEPNAMTRALVARRRARMRHFMTRILGVALFLFVAQCIAAALTAPQFQIKRVEKSGLQSTPAAVVEQLAAPLVGQNIFRARGAALAQKVEALPTVARARVVRPLQWPPHLRLQITERQPFVRVGAGQNWWVADAGGVPFRRATDKDETLYALTAPQFAPQIGKVLPPAPWARARELVLALQADNALAASANAPTNAGATNIGAGATNIGAGATNIGAGATNIGAGATNIGAGATNIGAGATNIAANAASDGAPVPTAASNAPPFWQLRRLYLDRDGFAAVRVSGAGALAAQRELLIRLGEEDWPAKLAQARVALAYFGRTGQRAKELDLVSGEHPRWQPLDQVAQKPDGINGVS